MSFGKYTRDFRQTIKDKGYSVRIGRDYYDMTIKDGRDEIFHSEWTLAHGILFLNTLNCSESDVFSPAMSYWAQYAKEHLMKGIVIPKRFLMYLSKLENIGFCHIADHEKSEMIQTVYPDIQPESMFLEINRELINKFYDLKRALNTVFDEIKSDNPASEFQFKKGLYHMFDGSFYHHGCKGVFYFGHTYNLKDFTFTFRDSEDSKILFTLKGIHDDLESFKGSIALQFKKIYKKQRLKNLYEPPKYHFRNFLNTIPLPSSFTEPLFNLLLDYYSAEEIEEKLAGVGNQNSVIVNAGFRSGVIAFEMLNYLFIIDKHTKECYCYSQGEFDQFCKKIDEIYMNIIKNDYEGKFDTFKGELDEALSFYDGLLKGEVLSRNIPYSDHEVSYRFQYYYNIRLLCFMGRMFVVDTKNSTSKAFEFHQLEEAKEEFYNQVLDIVKNEYKEKLETFQEKLLKC